MQIQSMEGFLGYYAGIHQRTLRVVHCIPDDGFEWRYAANRFSAGDLVRHIAAVNRYTFVENAAGRPSVYPGHGPEIASGGEAVREYFRQRHAESMEILNGMTDGHLQSRCTTVGGASMPVWKWLRAMVEHEVHHRGQLYMLAGMLGVSAPPIFGLTAEEVQARSAAPLDPPAADLRPEV